MSSPAWDPYSADFPKQPNAESIRTQADMIASKTKKIDSTVGNIKSDWAGMKAVYKTPDQETVYAAVNPVKTTSGELEDSGSKVKGALDTYADWADDFKSRKSALMERYYDIKGKIEDGGDDWNKDQDLFNDDTALLHDADALAADHMAAERTCANAIEALFGGIVYVETSQDGPGSGETEYGFSTDQLDAAAAEGHIPWGEPNEWDKPWYKDAWDGVVSFGKGVWSGVTGTVTGLWNMVNFTDGETFAATWKGIGTLALDVAIVSSPITAAVAETIGGPGTVKKSGERLITVGKAAVHWDEWKEDPAYAAGQTTFDLATILLTAGGGAVAKTGSVASKISKVSKGSGLASKTVNISGLAKLSNITLKGIDLKDLGKLKLKNYAIDLKDIVVDVTKGPNPKTVVTIDPHGLKIPQEHPGATPAAATKADGANASAAVDTKDAAPVAARGDGADVSEGSGSKSGADAQEGSKPGADAPEGSKPGADAPEGSKPGVDAPEGSKSGAEGSGSKGVDAPEGSKSGSKGADAPEGSKSKSGSDASEGSTPGADAPEGSKSGADAPEGSKSGADVPEGSGSTGADVPEGSKSKSGSDASEGSTPGADAPEGSTPGADAPEGSKSGADAPEGSKSGADAPEGSGSTGADVPEGSKSGADVPEGSGSTGADVPEGSKSEAAGGNGRGEADPGAIRADNDGMDSASNGNSNSDSSPLEEHGPRTQDGDGGTSSDSSRDTTDPQEFGQDFDQGAGRLIRDENGNPSIVRFRDGSEHIVSTNLSNLRQASAWDDVSAAMERNGVDKDWLRNAAGSHVEVLSPRELSILRDIRHSIPAPDDTTLFQKVLHEDEALKLFDSTNGHRSGTVGYITRAEYSAALRTPADIYRGLRLDYLIGDKPGPYLADNSKAVYAARFRVENIDDGLSAAKRVRVPDGRLVDRLEGSDGPHTKPTAPSDYSTPSTHREQDPNMGGGFTGTESDKADLVPEDVIQKEPGKNSVKFEDGAELWKLDASGQEILVGIFDASPSGGLWKPVLSGM